MYKIISGGNLEAKVNAKHRRGWRVAGGVTNGLLQAMVKTKRKYEIIKADCPEKIVKRLN